MTTGRCGGGTAARALLGFDEIGEIVRRFLNIDDFPPLPPEQSVSVQMYLTSYPVPSNGPATLRDKGRWAG